MSAKKSWDVRPNVRRVVRHTADPMLERQGKAARNPSRPLKARRRAARRRVVVFSSILAILIVSGLVYGLSQPAVRIQNIQALGVHQDDLVSISKEAITGKYAFILPKDSIFLFSKDAMRAAIFDAYADVSAVAVSRTSFSSISVSAIDRVPAFWWCGNSPESSVCYEADAEGFVFAPVSSVSTASSSTPQALSLLKIYAPLIENSGVAPLRAHVAHANDVPNVLAFIRTIESLGTRVSSVQFIEDEANIFLEGGTRVIYILGHEQAAANLVASAFPQINVIDGSVDYIDLRFNGKVYVKKRGETVNTGQEP
ncbi:MAG: hypothetical protein WAV21_03150 [Minisyncoccia bacterium]